MKSDRPCRKASRAHEGGTVPRSLGQSWPRFEQALSRRAGHCYLRHSRGFGSGPAFHGTKLGRAGRGQELKVDERRAAENGGAVACLATNCPKMTNQERSRVAVEWARVRAGDYRPPPQEVVMPS